MYNVCHFSCYYISNRLLRRESIYISVFISPYKLRQTKKVNSTGTAKNCRVYHKICSLKVILVFRSDFWHSQSMMISWPMFQQFFPLVQLFWQLWWEVMHAWNFQKWTCGSKDMTSYRQVLITCLTKRNTKFFLNSV